MTRKFPELADLTKTAGFHSIVQHQSQLLEELSPYYELYASITEFVSVCQEAMSLSKNFVALDFQENNAELCDLFLDVFVLYFKVL
jgi:predicted urease superfamily metal-dependent hydrolase